MTIPRYLPPIMQDLRQKGSIHSRPTAVRKRDTSRADIRLYDLKTYPFVWETDPSPTRIHSSSARRLVLRGAPATQDSKSTHGLRPIRALPTESDILPGIGLASIPPIRLALPHSKHVQHTRTDQAFTPPLADWTDSPLFPKFLLSASQPQTLKFCFSNHFHVFFDARFHSRHTTAHGHQAYTPTHGSAAPKPAYSSGESIPLLTRIHQSTPSRPTSRGAPVTHGVEFACGLQWIRVLPMESNSNPTYQKLAGPQLRLSSPPSRVDSARSVRAFTRVCCSWSLILQP